MTRTTLEHKIILADETGTGGRQEDDKKLLGKKLYVTTRGGMEQEANEGVGYENQISSPSISMTSESR